MAILGTAGIDNLIGTVQADVIRGYGGNDVINGGGGTDTIYAGAGDDTIVADTYGQGFAILDGGSGDDTLELHTSYFLPLNSLVSIENIDFRSVAGEQMYLLLSVDSSAAAAGSYSPQGPTQLTGGAGVDLVYYYITGGMGSAAEIVMPTLSATNWSTSGKVYDDTSDAVWLLAQDSANYVLRATDANGANGILQGLGGGGGNDRLIGSSGSDLLSGGGGFNRLFGNGGDDVLYVSGKAGSLFDGGAGIDFLSVTGEVHFNGTLRSIEGINLFTSLQPPMGIPLAADFHLGSAYVALLPQDLRIDGTGNLYFEGLSAFDGTNYQIIAGSNVTLSVSGTTGDDTFIGTSGDDFLEGGAGNNSLDGAGGRDAADYRNASGGVTVSLGIAGPQATGFGTDSLTSIENLIGSAHGDTLTGNSGNNVIEGMDGDDVLAGGSGADTVSFRHASYVSGSVLTVNLSRTGAQDTVVAGLDTLTGFENVTGSLFDDAITGNAGANTLSGLSGNDTLAGGRGNDLLDGGFGLDFASYVGSAAVTVSLAIAGEQDTVGAGRDTLVGIEGLIGSSQADTLEGNDGYNILDGRGGADIMRGGAGGDVYYVDNVADQLIENATTEYGFDEVHSTVDWTLGANFEQLYLEGSANLKATGNNAAYNLIYGNSGNNILDGKGGHDEMYGGAGNDTYIVNSEWDSVWEYDEGGIDPGGIDTIRSSFSQYLDIRIENLVLTGTEASEGHGNELDNKIIGSSASNSLYGEAGRDFLNGSDGNDFVYGGDGDDTVRGGAGDDWVGGEAGTDLISGGTGADNFLLGNHNDSTLLETDVISDFSHADGDRIVLHYIDANTTTPDFWENFTLVSAFSHSAGQLVIETFSSGRYRVLGDVDGDANADIAIIVHSSTALVADDFWGLSL